MILFVTFRLKCKIDIEMNNKNVHISNKIGF